MNKDKTLDELREAKEKFLDKWHGNDVHGIEAIPEVRADLDALIAKAQESQREKIAKAEGFWKDIYPEGMEPANVLDELADFQMVSSHCNLIYCHVTRSRISKPQTDVSVVIQMADEIFDEEFADLVRSDILPDLCESCHEKVVEYLGPLSPSTEAIRGTG